MIERKTTYTLVLPQSTLNEVKMVADERNLTIAEMFQLFTTLGLFAIKLEKKPTARLIVQDDDMICELRVQ